MSLFSNSSFLFEQLRPTLSHLHYTYDRAEQQSGCSTKGAWRATSSSLPVKASQMCLTFPTCECFPGWAPGRNPSEVCDSRLDHVIQSVQSERQQQHHQLVPSVCSKGQWADKRHTCTGAFVRVSVSKLPSGLKVQCCKSDLVPLPLVKELKRRVFAVID